MKALGLVLSLLIVSAAVAGTGGDVHSRLTGRDLTIAELTKDATTLQGDTLYYLTTNLVFEGSVATNALTAGAAGLSVADGATVFLYIPEGKTLSVTGGAGYAARSGEAPRSPTWKNQTDSVYGVSHTCATFEGVVTEGGAGGAGASGGGPGIYVPETATLVVFGEGTLQATGGAGGAAGVSTNSLAEAKYAIANWCCNVNKDINDSANAVKFTANNLGIDVVWSGKATSYVANVCWGGRPLSGGGGSGGGGGGGAAIGTAGGFGTAGVAGARQTNDWDWDTQAIEVQTTNAVAKAVTPPSAAGTVYLALPAGNCQLTGGAGGAAGEGGSSVTTNAVTFTYYRKWWDARETLENHFNLVSGSLGGVGGAGGQGALFGAGGAGGVGGAGGDTGAIFVDLSYQDGQPMDYSGKNLVPKTIPAGENGEAAVDRNPNTLADDDYPYSTISFGSTNLPSRAYAFSRKTTIEFPDDAYVGSWRVATFAKELSGVTNTSTAFLAKGLAEYELATNVTIGVATYGDVQLGLRRLRSAQVSRASDFYQTYLKGMTLDEMDAWLEGAWYDAVPRWSAYVLGLPFDARLTSRIGKSEQWEIAPIGLTTNVPSAVVELNPPEKSGYDILYRYRGVKDFAPSSSEWTILETLRESGGVRAYRVSEGADAPRFFKLSVDFEKKGGVE